MTEHVKKETAKRFEINGELAQIKPKTQFYYSLSAMHQD